MSKDYLAIGMHQLDLGTKEQPASIEVVLGTALIDIALSLREIRDLLKVNHPSIKQQNIPIEYSVTRGDSGYIHDPAADQDDAEIIQRMLAEQKAKNE